MAELHETAYPRIKPNLSAQELHRLFTPDGPELDLLNQHTRKNNNVSRLCFMMMLKSYQCLGRPKRLDQIDECIRIHIAKQLGFDADQVDISLYPRATRKRHLIIIRNYLEINTDQQSRRDLAKKTAIDAAQSKENLADIINAILEALILDHYEIPGYTRLLKLARAARTLVNKRHFQQLLTSLSDEQIQCLNQILAIDMNDEETEDDQSQLQPFLDDNDVLPTWRELKQEPKKPTYDNVRNFIKYVNRMRALRDDFNVDLSGILPARLLHLRDEAMVTDRSDMRRISKAKRYSLAVILIHVKTIAAVDDLVHVFIAWLRKIESIAKQRLKEYRLAYSNETDDLIKVLHDMLLLLKQSTLPEEQIKDLKKRIKGQHAELIHRCEEHLGLTDKKHIRWMRKPYCNKRSVIFDLIEQLPIYSSTQDKGIEKALTFIKHYRSSHKEWLTIDKKDEVQPDVSVLSKDYYKVAIDDKCPGDQAIKVHRQFYEIAVLIALATDLGCGDAYVEDAFEYDDPNKNLMTWEDFYEAVDQYCETNQLPRHSALFVELQKQRLSAAAKQVDDNCLNNPYLSIKNGKPVLKRTAKKDDDPAIDKIRKLVMAEMPVLSIVDVIIAVEQWLHISRFFKPLSGNQSKIKNYPSRFVATSLSYGCNLGPTQTVRCLPGFSRKQIAWLFNHHMTDERIDKAITWLVKQYNLFDLPKFWGYGDSASVDGTFWDMYTQNLIAAHHIRYGRYGGVGYYHVSDQYIALFSNFISSAAHECIYLLDDVVTADEDVKPSKIYGDSWAQSEVLFALSYLLGIKLMPRIKHFKHLNYYKASQDITYDNIDDIFSSTAIDWDLIETNHLDMLRVAMSVQTGKVKASTILRKLCSKSRKNKLYYAFRELGRVIRTIFLLGYIDDVDMRQTIQAATCKSEEFNEFIDWISFGGNGVISDNLRFSQRKIIKYNHLLANILIFHTAANQTHTVNKLRAQGIEIPNAALERFSPYWREHLNRFGMFTLDMDKRTPEIQYQLRVQEK